MEAFSYLEHFQLLIWKHCIVPRSSILKPVFSSKGLFSKEVIGALASVIGFYRRASAYIGSTAIGRTIVAMYFLSHLPSLAPTSQLAFDFFNYHCHRHQVLLYHGASFGTVPNDLMEEPASTKIQCFAKLCSDCNSFFEHWDNEAYAIDELSQIFSHHQFTKLYEHGKGFRLFPRNFDPLT
jgi:hypothetical protein